MGYDRERDRIQRDNDSIRQVLATAHTIKGRFTSLYRWEARKASNQWTITVEGWERGRWHHHATHTAASDTLMGAELSRLQTVATLQTEAISAQTRGVTVPTLAEQREATRKRLEAADAYMAEHHPQPVHPWEP